MQIYKKLTFAPLFLISLVFVFYQYSQILRSPFMIFSFGMDQLTQILILVGSVIFSGLFFALFVGLAMDIRFVLGFALISALIPFLFLNFTIAIFTSLALLTVLAVVYPVLVNKLKSYLTFLPTTLFLPSIKQFGSFLILILAFGYFLSINADIKKNGFKIPESLIDAAINLNPQTKNLEESSLGNFKLDQAQIDQLKKNPQLLKQYGLDIKDLEKLQIPGVNSSQSFLKTTLSKQFDKMLEPYIGFIPAVLALIFFFSLQSLFTLLSVLLVPLVWIIFYVLEKTGFIHFTTEMREVKKMVV